MARLNTVPHRRRRSEASEDSDASAAQHSEASSSKRPRLDSADDDEDEENGQESDGNDTPEPSTQTLPRQPLQDGPGPGGYKPGAIVRIKVTNFVTYTSAEFFPGPKLNMVIGPNGTGKSTLVCAICLGLGWGPQVCYGFNASSCTVC